MFRVSKKLMIDSEHYCINFYVKTICKAWFFTSSHFFIIVKCFEIEIFQFPDRKKTFNSHSGWRQTILQYVEIHFSSSIFHFHALLACLPINKMCVKITYNSLFLIHLNLFIPLYVCIQYCKFIAMERIVSLNTYWFVLLLFYFLI